MDTVFDSPYFVICPFSLPGIRKTDVLTVQHIQAILMRANLLIWRNAAESNHVMEI